jgi:hypothetical protein
MFTTAGMLFSSMGASEGSWAPSASGGKAAFADKAVKLRNKIRNNLVCLLIV